MERRLFEWCLLGRVSRGDGPAHSFKCVNASIESSRKKQKVDDKTGFTTKSIICIPLKIHGNILGVIEIINIEDIKNFTENKLPYLSILCDYAAIAIENSQYLSKIQRMSIIDEYTGLYNARYLHQILPELVQKSVEKDNKLSVVFMDVDNFKKVVDTLGHLAGSVVLKEIGQTILNCLTENDILIKYGGDEYILILPDRNKNNALEITKKIQNAIRESTYLKSEDNPIKVTASFGIAVFPDDAKNKKDLLIRADDSMYEIKKSTKNAIGVI